ncbi:hypothetical protein [Paenibacillus sp. FSL R5-0470]|uniref:hypothetical protein n=1 Tax=Paenibacillus sp. FSL R5-0470 TaxID=2921641 RepID=UPI0030DC5600
MEYLSITISLVSLVVCLTVYNKVSAMEARIKTMHVNVDQIAKSEGLPHILFKMRFSSSYVTARK